MRNILIFFLLLFILSTGIGVFGQARIIGGSPTYIDRVPFQVLLQINRVDKCGGSIIADSWIITACHCLLNEDGLISAGEIRVHAGLTSRSRDRNTPQHQERRVVEIIRHPSWGKDPNSRFDSDIALLRLNKPLDLSTRFVQAVSFATRSDKEKGLLDASPVGAETPKRALIVGWGRTSTNSRQPLPDTLQSVDVPIVPDSVVVRQYVGEKGLSITENMIGAAASLKDACAGDSGGPMILSIETPRVNQEGVEDLLIGVVSFGKGCAHPEFCGVYTKVPNYCDWITKNILETKIVDGGVNGNDRSLTFQVRNLPRDATVSWHGVGQMSTKVGEGALARVSIPKEYLPSAEDFIVFDVKSSCGAFERRQSFKL